MGAYPSATLPRGLLQARSRFEAWRRRCLGRGRIPGELWELAVQMVQQHGLSRTASVLRLDYYSLKKRAKTAGSELPSRSPTFVEISSSVPAGKQCLLELDNRAGATLRVQLIGYDPADLEALVRPFGNAG
jgi:hypothetical protein